MKTTLLAIASLVLASFIHGQEPQRPELRLSQMPTYPKVAIAAHVDGEVRAEFELDAQGNVTMVRMLAGTPLFLKTTEDTIRSWKFDMPKGSLSADRKYTTTFRYRFSDRRVPQSQVPRLVVTVDSFQHVDVVTDLYEIIRD